MAFKDFRPEIDYLKTLGFKETNSGKEHPYDRSFELDVNPEKGLKLCMNTFWDFSLETPRENFKKNIPNKEMLEYYISTLKKWRGDGMSFLSTLRFFEGENENEIVIAGRKVKVSYGIANGGSYEEILKTLPEATKFISENINNTLDLESTRLEIETKHVFSEVELVGFLNENSDKIINDIGSNITGWSFDCGQGIEVLNMFLERTKCIIPYRFFSNKKDSLIFEQKA